MNTRTKKLIIDFIKAKLGSDVALKWLLEIYWRAFLTWQKVLRCSEQWIEFVTRKTIIRKGID